MYIIIIFCIEEDEYHLKAGEAILIPPHLLHMAKRVEHMDCEFYAFVFSPSLISEAYTNNIYTKYVLPIMHNSVKYSLHLSPTISWQKCILDHLCTIYQHSPTDISQWELQVRGILLIMWQLLYNHHLSQIEISKNYSRIATQLEAAISLIHNSYEDEITLNLLANISNLSEGQFCRLFKQLTGFTPFSYLNRFRIIKSCDYLISTSKKITEVALLCGFNNISYYNREFAHIMKTTPSAYRKTTHQNSSQER